MALFNDQQQQEPENQLQPYGVSSGTRSRARIVQHVPYVPVNMNIDQHLFRARQLPAQPVREQQHHAMLQDRVNQGVLQQNIQQQDNIAYNPRPYRDQQYHVAVVPLGTPSLHICCSIRKCILMYRILWRNR